jgi:hypothetical protein
MQWIVDLVTPDNFKLIFRWIVNQGLAICFLGFFSFYQQKKNDRMEQKIDSMQTYILTDVRSQRDTMLNQMIENTSVMKDVRVALKKITNE